MTPRAALIAMFAQQKSTARYSESVAGKAADDIVSALHAAGFKVLARNPTNEMIGVAMGDYPTLDWHQMWDAAP